jgi:hypothetical protein
MTGCARQVPAWQGPNCPFARRARLGRNDHAGAGRPAVQLDGMESSSAGRRVSRAPGDDPDLTDEELIERRTTWFQAYTGLPNVFAGPGAGRYTCPCCGHPTLTERGRYEICDECWWEDDGQDDHDSAVVRGGPNGSLSLDAARSRYVQEGGVRGAHVPPDAAR